MRTTPSATSRSLTRGAAAFANCGAGPTAQPALVVNLIPLLRSRKISVRQKFDAFLLLFIYCVPPILLSGIAADALLFYMGAIR